MTKTLYINPADFQGEVNIAEVKALAAKHGAHVKTSTLVERGKVYVGNFPGLEELWESGFRWGVDR